MTASIAVLVLNDAGELQHRTVEPAPHDFGLLLKINKRLNDGPRFGCGVGDHIRVSHNHVGLQILSTGLRTLSLRSRIIAEVPFERLCERPLQRQVGA